MVGQIDVLNPNPRCLTSYPVLISSLGGGRKSEPYPIWNVPTPEAFAPLRPITSSFDISHGPQLIEYGLYEPEQKRNPGLLDCSHRFMRIFIELITGVGGVRFTQIVQMTCRSQHQSHSNGLISLVVLTPFQINLTCSSNCAEFQMTLHYYIGNISTLTCASQRNA